MKHTPIVKKRKKLHGTVEKIIKPLASSQPEKAQIGIDEADDLYREIRVENVVTDENGQKERLAAGTKVDVIVEVDTGGKSNKSQQD